MGKITKGILGGFSGKVGNVVGASWNGIDYIRSLPTTVRNPRTPGQVNQRNKFSTVISFLSQITPLIRVGFSNYANKQTAFNAAMSYNVLNAMTGEGSEVKMDYPKVLVSRGNLFASPRGDVKIVDNKVNMSWDSLTSGSASDDDKALLVIFNSVTGESKYMLDACARSEGSYTIEYPATWEGDDVETYVGFVSEDGVVSNSLYLGKVEIPEG